MLFSCSILIDEDDLSEIEQMNTTDDDTFLNAGRCRSKERRDTVSDNDLVGSFTRAGLFEIVVASCSPLEEVAFASRHSKEVS